MPAEVLVVGAGPVGMTLALELARYGVAVRIVDRAAQRTDKSKALVIWSRSLELFDRSGRTGAFLAAGHVGRGATINVGKKRLAQIDFAAVNGTHPYLLLIPQSETERVLEESLALLGVRVERNTELLRLGADATAAQATLRRPDGTEEGLEVGWMVGADGAHSTVRHGLGLPFEGTTLPVSWLLADVHLTGLGAAPDLLEMYWHQSGVLALFPIGVEHYRIIADLGPTTTERPQQATLEQVQAVLDQRGPGGLRASNPLWLTTFDINERKVASYRSGRVFVAGDAAHVHSPAGGQGMNTGMQDAFNLGWKLALVIHGSVSPELLDSYGAERSPVAEHVLAGSGKLTSVALLHGPAAHLRNAVAHLVMGLAPARRAMADTLSEVSIGYPKSPLTWTGHTLDGPMPGERAPPRPDEPPPGSGARPRFALHTTETESLAALASRFPDLVDPLPRRPFGRGGTWLVRPDGYVGATAREGQWDTLTEYLAALQPRTAGARAPRD